MNVINTHSSMIKAVIFDMDGVIADTNKYHSTIESKLLKRFGIYIQPELITKKYAGVSDKKMFIEIFKQHHLSIKNIPELTSEKWILMRKITKGKIKPIPYVLELIISLKEKGLKLAIASASTKDFIIYILDQLGIKDKFSVIVSSDEVKHGKPSPDIFLLAAKRLGVNSHNVVVIEDGINGMIGAQKANMKCIGYVADKASDYPATIIVSSFNDLRINDILSLE